MSKFTHIQEHFKTNTSSDKLQFVIIGLGNPGGEFQGTWHNMGREFVSFIKKELQIKLPDKSNTLKMVNAETWSFSLTEYNTKISPLIIEEIITVESETYMNTSGSLLQEINQQVIKYRGKSEQNCRFAFAYDDLDLDFGNYKFQINRFPKSHNGVNSLLNTRLPIASETALHIRIGIRNPENGIYKNAPRRAYVLSKLSREEIELQTNLYREITSELFAIINL